MNQNGFESDEQEQYYIEVERQRQEEEYHMEQYARQNQDDYSIETHNSGRFIVWRIKDGDKLRQGSHESYDEAVTAMERSIDIMK